MRRGERQAIVLPGRGRVRLIFLFPGGAGASLPDPLDPRLRMAADLYNRGITLGLASADETVMEMRAGTYELPWASSTWRSTRIGSAGPGAT